MSGVSAGTVDRVLHNRGDVSVSSREKVQKVLDEIDYHPNMFAIGLAAKKRYHIVCIIPYYIEHDYWHAVAAGIDRAAQELRPFNVGVSYLYYRHADKSSYKEACAVLREENADAVLVAPNFREETIKLTTYLEEADIPYAFIDFNIEQTHALCYIGQDSKTSGYIAAKILMRSYEKGQELVLFLSNQKNNPAEIQMQRRLEGFMQYLSEEHKDLTIHDIVLHKEDTDGNRRILDAFFKEHPSSGRSHHPHAWKRRPDSLRTNGRHLSRGGDGRLQQGSQGSVRGQGRHHQDRLYRQGPAGFLDDDSVE